MPQTSIRWFQDLRMGDVPLVGGKTASLGELYSALAPMGIAVPNGFGITAGAYRAALTVAKAWEPLRALMEGLNRDDVRDLAERAAKARQIVYAATGTEALKKEIAAAYRELEQQYGRNVSVAVRSSATAEDLPTASFAGQHESYLNVRGAAAVFEACRHCFASLFTDRAIVYRNDNGFDHFKVALSVAVMKMVRSDKGASGVMFTIDTETGFRDVVLINGIYGLGENIVQGRVDPDEFYVHKPTYRDGKRAVLRHTLGGKALTLVFATGKDTTRNTKTAKAARERFCIADEDVLQLAGHAIAIEDHYSKINGQLTPMDIEWAKDGVDNKLYIVQARPETAASQKKAGQLEVYTLKERARPLVTGRAIGEKIAAGLVRVVASEAELQGFQAGEILVAATTTPDWEPVMKKAGGIVTDRGGRTCHAAIVARELGIPAVVGSENATTTLKTGSTVTISCAEGDIGHVYEGKLAFDVSEVDLSGLPRPKTRIMINLGDPDLAFQSALLPNDGVGLARMEFIINEFIGIHPMALVHPERVKQAERRRIEALTANYARPQDFFIERLSEGVGMIAAVFYPKPVIVRLSDFKTNEYARLLGGAPFEPVESNPMIGFRGASRYAHPAYAEGFALECAALARVRGEMGLTNLKIMVPFCRREEEAQRVVATMAARGLRRGENGLEIYVMCEIPNNVIRIDAFSEVFDGFSIGSNDLTQLTLGVDRDSEIVAFDFDERDPGMTEMLRLAVEGARRNGRHVGICGEAPANYPEVAARLAGWGIDSISVNPGSVIKTFKIVAEAEHGNTGKK
ncbi:MAG: phosphoenolpyruvate synthase [Alphaproteobacteria bacterium]|nr:phosphoenolpyruvate synthase [Alphaproteobacteria bacterium]MDE2013059.1 phosphoenolpyruvate synthase [Alphaproteobacteria bacterium]